VYTKNNLILTFALLPLLAAYGAEYLYDAIPCALCVYQRIPYIIIALFAIINTTISSAKKYDKATDVVFEISLISSFCLSLFHYGVEKKIFKPDIDCVNNLQTAKTFEEFEMNLMHQNYVLCDQATFEILGVPMSFLNILYSIFFFILIVKLNKKNAKK
jgi:disulfide bond formation protein DsbB